MSSIAKVTLEISRATVVMIVIALGVGFLLGSTFPLTTRVYVSPTGQSTVPSGSGGSPSIPTSGGAVQVSEDDDPSIGDKNAKIVMIEFSDFQCPFCKRFRDSTFDQIKTAYIDNGKVRFVYRDFPLSSIHPSAEKAAEAANCAGDQGKFWEYHDELFKTQDTWASGDDIVEFKSLAKSMGLDSTKFDSCLDSGKHADEIQKDFQDGLNAGVSGTPTFFINGKELVGAQPYSAFKAALDAALAS